MAHHSRLRDCATSLIGKGASGALAQHDRQTGRQTPETEKIWELALVNSAAQNRHRPIYRRLVYLMIIQVLSHISGYASAR